MKQKHFFSLLVIGGIWLGISVSCLVSPAKESSESERRNLAQFPKVSLNTIVSGSFMEKFETYAMDQFPLRDKFRTLKAVTSYYVLGQKDTNDLYEVDGYVAKLDYPLNEDSVKHALERFEFIYETYLKGNNENIFLSVIPDKGYFLAKQNGYPSMDYEALFKQMEEGMPYAKYVDISEELTIDSFYKTDTHWRQEKIQKVAQMLGDAMGVSKYLSSDYEMETATDKFYGVYYGQSALPLKAETLSYLSNTVLEKCVVSNVEDESVNTIYNMKRVEGKDPYEMFLSGATSLITIENPNSESEKELIVFRDSFGSSLVPLLAEGYSKITLLDIRYIKSDMIGDYVEFKGQDVLFLYSSLLLNSSYTMK